MRKKVAITMAVAIIVLTAGMIVSVLSFGILGNII